MNIPTSPEGLAKACQGQPKDIAEAITQTMKPTIVKEAQTQMGGFRRHRKTLKKRKSKQLLF